MRTTDALAIGMALGRIKGTLDAWEESKHPRRPDGKFGSGGGNSSSVKKDLKEGRKKVKSGEWTKADFENQKKGIRATKEGKKKAAAETEKRSALINQYKQLMASGDISKEDKVDLAYGRRMVEEGKWSEQDFEDQIKGIAMSKGGGGGTSKPKAATKTPTDSEVKEFIAKVTGKKPFYGVSPEEENEIKTIAYRVDKGYAAPEDLQYVAREILTKRMKRNK